MTLRGVWGGAFGFAGLLAAAVTDALLAALAVSAVGAVACLVWYVAVEGAPPLGPVIAAWSRDAPIPLGLFLPPCLVVLAALYAGAARLFGALWEAARGGKPLRWLPRLQRLVA